MWKNIIFLSTISLALVFADIKSSAAETIAEDAVTVCDQAANFAAQDSVVPLSVLMSIARVETGQGIGESLHPWPWTINVAGKGFFFDTKEEALRFAQTELDAGNVNFDIGCFQINLRWHSKGFVSLDEAFDPTSNARYAARFLETLFQEHGSWSGAVSAYHSRTKAHAVSYLGKVKAVWQDLQEATPSSIPAALPTQRENNFPLLKSGRGANGSLMPQQLAAKSLFVPR